MNQSEQPESSPLPSSEPNIKQQADSSILGGGMQAAIGDGNFQIQFIFHPNSSPNYQNDWIKLIEQTRENLTIIPDRIGNKIFISRLVELEAIETAFENNKVVVLLGASGCGKTVISKSWAEKEQNANKTIWWKASSFDVSDFSSFQNRLGLSSPLRDVLAAVSAPRVYVVIDGLDRIFSEAAFQNLSVLIHTLRLNVEDSPWRLLIPCQLEEWNRVQMLLARANVLTEDWKMLQVGAPSINDFEPVWETFPALKRLNFQPQLQSLLFKPKVLDLLATKLSTGGSVDTTQWVGESNLIEWFWETEVCKQPNARMRAGLLKSLGEKQADNLESETATDAFSISDLAQVDSLIRDRLCQEREERLSFCHDLYGDWARQRVLLGQKNNLRDYIKHRVSSPLWHRAVRLYGLHLLEKNEDTAQWRSALVSLCGDDNTPDLTSDLLLEAVVFAANPLPLLERIWADLAANDGLLLRRLLAKFLFIATLPNPAILAIASQLDSDLETTAATIQRIPYFPYWVPILQFLHRHLTDVIELAPGYIAEIANTWLRRLDTKWPLRREAAELALATAERLLESTKSGRFFYEKDDLSKKIYHAALAGVYELPDRVANFALKASARKEFITQKTETETQSEPLIKRVIDDPEYGTYELELDESSWSRIDEQEIDPIIFRNFSWEFGDEEEEEPVAWTDGPSQKVHSAFRQVCLTTDAIYPLIIANPSVAREVLLALLIEEPRIHRRESGIHRQRLEIVYIQEWGFPLYNQGTFFFFLKNQPQEGLELILHLVNFATERWSDSWRRENQKIPEVLINVENNEYKWIGNQEVYYWYCNHHLCPYPIAVALMALEKWLYDEIDANKLMNDVLQLILQRSNSVAFAGLLSALARKAHFLFQGVLRPLLTVPEFYLWESQHRPLSVPYITGTRRYLGQSEETVELVREWYELPHRKHGLHQWALSLFLNTPEMQSFFEEARLHWLNRLQGNSKEDGLKCFLEELVDNYNIENYRIQNHSGYGDFWVFESPKKTDEKEKALRQASELRLQFLSFPFRCHEILNAGQPLPDEQLEQSWNFLQQLAGFPSVEDDTGLYDIENSICGGIAVLIQFHWNWLQQYPEREQWCIEQLIKIIHEPPKANKFGNEESNLGWEWDIFCAKIIPLIWSKFSDSNKWRECVALLVTSSRYAVVNTVFAHAAKFRISFYEDFKRLQHLLFRWAAVRWKWDSTRYGLESSFDIEVERNREIKAFLDKIISPNLPTWEEVATQVWEELADKKPHQNYNQPGLFGSITPSQFPSLNFRLIQAAYAWLPSLDQAISRTERQEWITFWKEALKYSLQFSEKDGTLSTWNEWLSQHIASLIMQLPPTEKPEDFWKPILSLGMEEKHWIEKFLIHWFVNGLSSEPIYDRFVQECHAMVEFAFSSPNWEFEPKLRQYGLEELWCYLVGLNSSINNMWTIAHKPTIKRMYIIYQQWATQHLNKPGCALQFVAFLLKPAAEEVRIDSLPWLYAASQSNEQFWTEYNIQEKLASLLDVCWRYHESKLRQHHDSFNAFKNLLKKLADFQNTLALEIQHRIASI
ncbi:hypothetical protein IQ243_24190 [Nostocales cyanobacterium LEGE 11386]|nr:hypothetical protein [Nostocales cyanobacterium LEGE 11386]